MSSIYESDFNVRQEQVAAYFPTALGIDDFISRMEMVLATYGFTGDNCIAMTNLCRDEVTSVLKDKIEAVFGSSFNTNGLGGVLTCGVTGMKGGLSHSPVCSNGRERYVFFSFPHIAIDSEGTVGRIIRPGRETSSCACGALHACLEEIKEVGYTELCREPGVHDPLDPEFSILKQRLARRLRYEKANAATLTLDELTRVAERTITNDLEYLIERCVDHNKADYAVVTGVQIHNWASKLTSNGPPSLEFVAPTKVFVVMDHKKTHLDLSRVPSLSPRQLMLLGSMAQMGQCAPAVTTGSAVPRSTSTSLHEVPAMYLNPNRWSGPGSMPRLVSDSGAPSGSQLPPSSTSQGQVRVMQASWHAPISSKFASNRDRLAPNMENASNAASNRDKPPPPPDSNASYASNASSGSNRDRTDGQPGGTAKEGGGMLTKGAVLLPEIDTEEDTFNTSFLKSRIRAWTSYPSTQTAACSLIIDKGTGQIKTSKIQTAPLAKRPSRVPDDSPVGSPNIARHYLSGL